MSIKETLLSYLVTYNTTEHMLGDYYTKIIPEGRILGNNRYKVYLMDNNGIIHKLSTFENEKYWEYHCKLYDSVKNDDRVRIEKPLNLELFVTDKIYYYSQVERFNGALGVSFYEDMFDGIVDVDYYKKYIEEVGILLGYLKNVSNVLPPEFLAIYKRYRINDLYCHCDLKDWRIPFNVFTQKRLRSLYIMLRITNCRHINEIMKEAENKWKNYLNF